MEDLKAGVMVLVCRLQVMHKAPVTEAKQVEHIVSERRVIGEGAHPFCVKLRGAYQDANSLYLLQDWVAGAALASSQPPGSCCCARLS